MKERTLETRRGIQSRLLEVGEGPPLLYLHGAAGLLDPEPLLERLGERFRVLAPEWPGYGDAPGEEKLEDMLDFALHGCDVVDALGLEAAPHLVGHSMGGMIAAEMAALAPAQLDRLALVAPAGLWSDEHPIPDLFAMTPFELPKLLFHDPKQGERLLTAGLDFGDGEALKGFMIRNARRLGTAGKILFPIPNRRLSKRLYRVRASTLLVWGREDRLIPPVYADLWKEGLGDASIELVAEAGHMAPYEQTAAVAEAIEKHLA